MKTLKKTAGQYAIEAFERYGANTVTLSPFMDLDSVAHYPIHPHGKGAFLLCRASNSGGDEPYNQRLASVDGQMLLYKHIARLEKDACNINDQFRLVVGATYPAEIDWVQSVMPRMRRLIPGVVAHFRTSAAPLKASRWPEASVIFNSSWVMIYGFRNALLAVAVRRATLKMRDVLKAAQG